MSADIILRFITYFILYSFVGWILESVSKTIEQRKWVNSGFLYGPICPIYGLGSIIMLLCLNFLKDNLILLFFAAFIILSVWEYVVGIFLEKVFKTKYWDYSHLKFNFQGRLCLKNSIFWGVLGVAFIGYINPFVESYIVQIPNNILLCIDVFISVVILIDLVISIIAINNVDTMIKRINELGDNIKEKVKELKELKEKIKNKNKVEKIEKDNIEKTEKIIKNLKVRQSKLKVQIYKYSIRLKRAFPNMKSESITAFLNQKIDLKKLKENIKKKNKE